MALPTTLAEIGYYLLWAIGLIFLLILILSASALLLTRINFYAKFKFSNGVYLIKVRLLINYLFLKYNAFEVDDFEDDDKVKQMLASQEPESKTVEKNACYVTKTGEEIKIKTIQSQKHWDVYDIVIERSYFSEETDETSILAEGTDEISTPADETNESPVSTCETDEASAPVSETDESSAPVSETDELSALVSVTDESSVPIGETDESPVSACETDETSAPVSETDGQITHEASVSEDSDPVDEKTDSGDTEPKENKSFQHELEDLSDSYDEIKMYVDLSNPKQFILDSLTAAAKISVSGSRLIGALLLRMNIKNLSFNFDYGFSDPANTAISYGVIQSFISGIYAYLDSTAKKSHSSYKRKRSKEIASHIQNNVFITPAFMEKKVNLESEVSVSFWIIRFYIPLLRFLFSKNTRWVLRRYVWVYYIKHYLKNQIHKKFKRKEAPAPSAAL